MELPSHMKARSMSAGTDNHYAAKPDFDLDVPEIRQAVEYQEQAGIARHPFFKVAAKSRNALEIWAAQEYITSANFSQVLAEWISTIDNYNVRSLVIPVLAEEHSDVRSSIADRCHPNLARNLCLSLGIDLSRLTSIRPTEEFIDQMEASGEKPLVGAGFLGVGNERMLIPEYGAVRECFMESWRETEFAPFLDANIADDRYHHDLIEHAAAGMISLGQNAADFLAGAIAGVDARIRYYDSLCEFLG